MMYIVAVFALIPLAFGIDPTVEIKETSPKTVINVFNQKEVVVLKNKDASLTCNVINKEPDKKVEWLIYDPENPSGSSNIATNMDSSNQFKYQVDQPSVNSWRLRIQNVQVSDESKYICQVSIGNQKFAQSERWIRVTEIPQIIDLQTSSDTTISEGDPVTLSCNSSGRPTPMLKWERLAGGVLPNGGREHRENILNMGKATPNHRGHYKCSAQNEQGKDQRIIQVIVRFHPRVSVDSEVVEQAVGYRQDLLCIVAGYPVPNSKEITWSKNGVALSGGNYIIKHLESADSRVMSKLTVKNVQTPDFGYYKCTAGNNEGSGEADIELKQSSVPLPDLTGLIHSGASFLTVSLTTVFMLLSVCFLHFLRL